MMQVFDNQGNLKQKSLVTSGVNSVTATPPLFSTGGSAPDISIALATALSDGYLSSVDWSTFNNKQNALTLTTIGSSGAATLIGATLNIPQYTDQYLGTVTSVGLSAGTGISIGGTNPVTSSGTISVTNTAPDQIVALTAGTGIGVSGTYPNFTITNSAPSPAGAITGSGTSGQVAYWTGTSSQSGSNNLFWDAANNRLGIGTTSPGHSLTVNGDISLSTSQTIRWGSSLGISKTLNQLLIYGGTASGVNGGTLLHYWNGSAFAVGMQLTNNSNLILQAGGTFTDGGQRLQVNGDALIKGSGNTGGTTALTVQNSAASTMMSISNDAANAILNITGSNYGMLQLNQTTANRNVFIASFSTSVEFGVGSAITNYRFLNAGGYGLMRINTNPFPTAGGDVVEIPLLGASFAPTSGSATATMLTIRPTINQTGGASGITRGLYVNPILTAAADWRSIEWSNNSGWGLYGAGTSNNYLAGALGIGSTSLTGYNLFIQRNLTGAATGVFSIYQNSSIQSDVTGTANGIGSFTGISGTTALGTLRHFVAAQGTFAAGGTVTTQIGYSAASTLTGATNNYGFYGDIASGTGRWNLYMNGTADNYLAGNLSVGSTTTTAGYAIRANGGIYATANLRFDGAIRDNRDNATISQSASGVTTNRVLTIGNATYLSLVVDNANLLLGSTTDGGQKLQVTGNAIVTGSAVASTALLVRNSTPANVFAVRGDSQITIGASASFGIVNNVFNTYSPSSNILGFASPSTWATDGIGYWFFDRSATSTSSNLIQFRIGGVSGQSFAPTSGTATHTTLQINATINQTGGANGITRGLYINPTLTAAADWRAIEISSGGVYINTASVNASAILQADSTTKGMLPPRMTNAQMVAIGTPAAGLMVYDTTNNKLNVYDGTNWVAVH